MGVCIPFAKSREMCVDLEDEPVGKVDVFVDDIITVIADDVENLERITATSYTIIHILMYKAKRSIYIERRDLVSDKK